MLWDGSDSLWPIEGANNILENEAEDAKTVSSEPFCFVFMIKV